MSKPIFIIGAGGHAKVLLECLFALNCYSIVGMIETNKSLIGRKIFDIEIFSQDYFLKNYLPSDIMLVNGLGSVEEPKARKKVFLFFKKRGYTFLTLIHPAAYVAKTVALGEGCQILAGSILQVETTLGDNVVINTGACVDHDCLIGHHSHVAPGVTLCGGVSVGESCHIGSGVTVIQEIKIGNNCLVAAGAVVTKHIMAGIRVAGIPASRMK